jgi:Fe-S cluster biogenesis protein NfuA
MMAKVEITQYDNGKLIIVKIWRNCASCSARTFTLSEAEFEALKKALNEFQPKESETK